jgi:hypothetical protein
VSSRASTPLPHPTSTIIPSRTPRLRKISMTPGAADSANSLKP